MITHNHVNVQLTFGHLADAPLSISVFLGQNFQIKYANRKALTSWGKEWQEVEGKTLTEIFPASFPSDLVDKMQSHAFALEKSFSASSVETTFFRNGKLQMGWYDITNQPLRDHDGVVIGILCFMTDVTESVLVSRQTKEREKYLTNFFKRAPVAIVSYRGPQFIVELANDKALGMWGKSIEEVKDRSLTEIFPQLDAEQRIRAVFDTSVEKFKKGEVHIVEEVELPFERNGKLESGWYTYIHEPYTDPDGNIIGVTAIAIDVTEQVMARRKTAASSYKLQVITDSLPSLISYVNKNEEYEFVNKAYEHWFGHSLNDLRGKKIAHLVGEQAYQKISEHIKRALSGEKETYEAWIPYKDGPNRYISATLIPHITETGVNGFFSLVNDLTERKLQEDSHRQNEQALRLIMEGVNAGTFEFDLNSRTIHASNELKSLLGLPKDQSISMELVGSVIHPEDLQFVLSNSTALLHTTNQFIAIDYRIIRQDNKAIRWMHSRSKLVFSDVDGKIIPERIIGFLLDITERKLIEEQLKEFNASLDQQVRSRTTELENINTILEKKNTELINSQSFLKQLIDSSVEVIAVVDKNLKYITVNSAFEKTTKLKANDVIGKSVTDVFESAGNSSQVEALKSALKGHSVNLNRYQAVTVPDMYVDTHFVPLVIKDQVEGVIIMVRDISKIVKTENELQSVIRQLQDAQQLTKLGSWEWNLKTGLVDWSDEMYRIYGYSEKFQVNFEKATERMLPEDAEKSKQRSKTQIAEAIKAFKTTGKRFFDISPTEFSLFLPNGTQKQVRSSGKIEMTEEGDVYRIFGAIQDVTELRITENELALTNSQLHEKNALLDSILTNSSNGISVSQLLFNEHGDVVDAKTILANDAAVRFSGLPKELYLTKPATFFDPNIIASPYGQACINTLKSGEPFITQYFLAYSSRWLELTVSRMDASHLIHIFTDVTAVKEAQLKLETSLEDLKRSNTNLEDFAYAASHDLNEPIRKFKIFIEQLKQDLKIDLNEKQINLIDRLENTANRMHSLVNSLLEYSYATKGIAEFVDVDLNITLQHVIEDLELVVQKKQAKIILQPLPCIKGNSRQLEQVFQNLISNALKYCKQEVIPEIRITTKTVVGQEVLSGKPSEILTQQFHLIEVLDNGIGFSPEYADSIFKMFTRLHTSTEYRGSGIGLAIVRKVIESHKGFIWADGEPGKGSAFRILLPVS
jgi:PAS domain S-box-containing protein